MYEKMYGKFLVLAYCIISIGENRKNATSITKIRMKISRTTIQRIYACRKSIHTIITRTYSYNQEQTPNYIMQVTTKHTTGNVVMGTIATKTHKQLNSMYLGLGVDDRSDN